MKKLLAVLLLVCLPVFGQTNQVWRVNDFSKGLNTKLSSLSLPPTQGDVCENVRFDKELRSLSKRDALRLYGTADTVYPVLGMHRLYTSAGNKYLLVNHSDQIEVGTDSDGTFTSLLTLGTANYRWQWETWHDLAMGTDGYNQPVKTDGTKATYLGTCHAADAGSGAGPDGTYTYKVSYYTTSYEVLFNVASNSVTVVDKDINLTMIPIAPTTYGGESVTGRKVYRSENTGSGTYKLVSNGTIANNTATTLTDTDADGALGAAYPAGDATYTPPKGKVIVIHKNRVWIMGNPTYPSRAYYSEDGLHDVFLSTSYFNVRENDGDSIMFGKNVNGLLTVGKENTIQFLYTKGSTPSADWSVSGPFSFAGCHSIYSVKNTPYGLIYLNRDGLYLFNGNFSKLISESVTPTIRDILAGDIGNAWGEYHGNKYYLSYTSELSGEDENNRVLILDLLANAYSIDLLKLNAFCTFNSGNDWGVLYSGGSDTGKVYAHGEASYQVKHSQHSDFDTGEFDDAGYIPVKFGGDADSPTIELRWTETIDELTGGINDLAGDVNRPDTDGTLVSTTMSLGASAFGKLYWNQNLGAYGDIYFNLRSGATTTDCLAATWGASVNNAAGADMSGDTANTYVQYKTTLITSDIDYTPQLVSDAGFVVKLTYFKQGSSAETAIPMRWRSGWTDLGKPGTTKSLKKIYVLYESDELGKLDVTIENELGETDVFEIGLATYPESYTEYFTNGKFIGDRFRITIYNNDLYDLTIKEIDIYYDVEPFI